ncbi:MAG TPA: TauD/TfdA family dioxygenase [Ramlibacter sp.]|uniref:TauD/TfdA family dioxygenase n=1 Tax=Ramlibacter sp. TaxID=1917967 RepID=UPI002C8F1291|nr:TauD/TfdA family dioxygenase [Ramlibacter sp.]HVZ45595.1 TauD/TfdA family dioxygenase [Ramlibacter sp.]
MTSSIPVQQGRHVWSGTELAQSTDWITTFTASEADDVLSALAAARSSGKPLEQIRRTDFPLPRLQAKFQALSRELESGRGFVLVRGLDLQGLSDDQCRTLFWGLGLQLGAPLSQSKLQNYIAEVRNIGEAMGQATTRAYRAGGPLRFHTDQCDVLALLCVREAISGGESRVVSSAAIHNAVLERRPDLLAELRGPFFFSRQGEEYGDELPWYERPIFDTEQGFFTSIFSRSYIESAQRMAQVPRLTGPQQEAIEFVSRLADELSVTIELRKGDMQFFNNHVTYHSRTDYEDHEDVAKRRTQLRLWLATPGSRPLPPGACTFFGDSRPGVFRGGVTPPSGRRFAFADWESAGWQPADLRAFGAGHAA